MKKRIKHLSKSTVSVILTLCMLVSCVTVGLIATDAAQVTGENRVGAAVSEDSSVAANAEDEEVGASVEKDESVGVNTYFTKGETIFIHAANIESSAYKDSAVVKAWFQPSGSALVTAKVGGINDHYYYAVVDAATYTGVQIQRFSSDGTEWWNSNGDVNQNARSNDSYNVIQTTSSGSSGASWENATYSFSVSGDITATLADSGEGIFSCTTSVNATKASYSFQITGSDSTTYVSDGIISGLTVGQTYNVTITYNIADNSYTAGITYPVTVKCGSHGKFTVANNTTDQTLYAGSVTGTTLPAMTADAGYRFVNWTVNDSSKVTVTNETSNGTAAVTATATGGIVTANFEAIGDTTIYVSKSDSVKSLYAFIDNTKLTGDWPGTADYFEKDANNKFTITSIGGIAYYKLVIPYSVINANRFTCIINSGVSSGALQTNDIVIDAGYTYYVGWSGASGNVAYSEKGRYPTYKLHYKAPGDSEFTEYSLENSMKDLELSRGTHQFYITKELDGAEDARYNNATFSRNTDAAKDYSKVEGIGYTEDSANTLNADYNGNYRIIVDSLNSDNTITVTIFYPHIEYYNVIGSFENNGSFFDSVAAWTVDPSKNVLTGDTTKTLTISSPIAVGTYFYKAVVTTRTPDALLDGGEPTYYNTYFPSPHDSDRNGCKEIEIAAGCTSLTFTFNSSTGAITAKAKYPTDWPPSEIETTYTDDVSDKYLVYSNNDDYASNEGNVARYSTALKRNSGGTAYWFDLTDLVLSDYSTWGNFYFCLSSETDKSGILGNSSNSVTDGKDTTNTSAADNGSINLPKTGTTLFVAQNKVKNTPARFVGLNSFKRDKLAHLGVVITDTSGTLDYKFYYQEDTKVSTGPKLVKIYAKNGELRDATYNRFTLLADTDISDTYKLPAGYAVPSDKEVEITHEKEFGNSTYDYAVNVPVGSTITISTQLKTERVDNDYGDTFANTHYLKAYSMNGKTYEIFTPNTSGVYSQTWTIPEDWEDDYIEITPIYYLKDSSLTKTFYIEKYAGSVQNKWGNLLSVYPYYEGKDNKANAFGGYPGQPMLYWGGKYQMEIPLTVDGTSGGAHVKGLTIHNSYWDLLHRSLDAKCKNHCQTYDYDDFYMLCKEKNPETIYFDFEYRTNHDNYADGYEYKTYEFVTSKNDTDIQLDDDHKNQTTIAKIEGANGAEIVTDYYGRQVDIFGNLLNTNARSTYSSGSLKGDELLIVSDGYKDTYVGEYATIWAVYTQTTKGNFTFLGYISSSMLYLNSLDNVKNYANGTSTSPGRMSDPNFTETYTALKNYKGKPVLISYEKELYNNSKDKANRSDGKWYYSAGNDKIQANIKIQYANSTAVPAIDDVSWKDESSYVEGYLGEINTGAYTGCSAYFTNTVPNIIGKQSSDYVLVDNSKFFTFKAHAAGKWVFAGWVRQNSDGKLDAIESTEGLGKSNISANDTYIARFVKATAGTLLASHTIEQTATYTGTGTPSITATLVESDGTTEVSGSSEITVTNGSDINLSSWMTTANATRGYKIKFVLETTTEDEDNTWVETLSKTGGYDIASARTTSATYSIKDIADAGTTSIRFVTHLTKTEYRYRYEITYHYRSRFWGDQYYKAEGPVPNDLSAKAYFSGSKTSAKLLPDFIKSQTPFEKNFRQKINWNYSTEAKTIGGTEVAAMTNTAAGDAVNGAYTMTAEVWSGNIVDDKAYAEFKLPYAFNRDGDMTATGSDVFVGNEKQADKQIIFDEGDFASKTVESQFYKLFAYNNSHPAGGENVSMTSANLVQAAPYVWKGATKHYTREYGTRTMSGTWTEGELTAADYVKAGTDPVPAEAGTTYRYYDADGTLHTDTSAIYYKGYVAADNYQAKIEYYPYLASYDLKTPYDKQDGYVLGENAKQYYFSGWKVYTTDMEYVATSYQPYFNLSAYDNYIIIPQYESTEEVIPASSGTAATITYLGDTRNQWTENGQGDYRTVTNYTDGVKGADKLIADFGISYKYNGQKLYTMPNRTTDPTNGHDVKIGMVIERMTALDEVAGVKQTSGTYYSEKFSDTYSTDSANLENYIKWKMDSGGSNTKSGNVLGRTYYAIGSNVDGYGVKFNTDQGGSTATGMMGFTQIIDNFNRLQYFHTITKAGTYDNTYKEVNQQDYAFRAVAFIEVDGALTLSDPVYFTVYETANRTSY